MKKSLTLISTAILALSLTACNDKSTSENKPSSQTEILKSVKYEDKTLKKVEFEQRTDRRTFSNTVIKRDNLTFKINLKSIEAEEALKKTGAEMIKVTKHEDNGNVEYIINADLSEGVSLRAVIASQKLILHPLSVKEKISKAEAQELVDAFSKHYQAYHDAYVVVEQGEATSENGMAEQDIEAAYSKLPYKDVKFPYNYEDEQHFYVFDLNTKIERQFIREIMMKSDKGGYEIVLVSDLYNPDSGKKVGLTQQANGTPLIQVQMLEALDRPEVDKMIEDLKKLHVESVKTGIYSPEAILTVLNAYKASNVASLESPAHEENKTEDKPVEKTEVPVEEKKN